MNIEQTLAERQKTHGAFKTHAVISQKLKTVMHETEMWQHLSDEECEALEMIAHKIARILNGNPKIHDHWHDIAGYATLVADRLK